MIEIGSKSKLKVKWSVSPYDYSPDKVREIRSKLSKKYNIPRDSIKVEPELRLLSDTGAELSVANDVISNIQDPEFQVKLFKEFIELNGIEDCDFDKIQEIDAEINAKIDYDVYDKFRRYSIKWIKWSNFLSYGEDNEFDFSDMKGLVLLNGEPANQSGKTTFAIDLLHFLLFGKTSKAATLEKIFNRHLPKATEAYVEGCITIDGTDYVIKRTLSRPQLSKRTPKSKTTQKVEYYKIVKGEREELYDYIENQQEENGIQTNKAIKETIGKEADFDLIMSVTEDNLDDLVKQKETERGRMLSRWIGLLPIEQKDTLARAKYNNDIKPYLLMNRYDKVTLGNEIEAYKIKIESDGEEIKSIDEKNKSLDKDIDSLENERNTLMSSMQKIDDNLLKIDIVTLNALIDSLVSEGKKKALEKETIKKEIEEIGEVKFSIDNFKSLNDKLAELTGKNSKLGERYRSLKSTVEQLKKSEYCPTCGRKLDNVDNSAKIEELSKEMNSTLQEGKDTKEMIDKVKAQIDEQSALHELYNKRSSLVLKLSAVEVNIEKLRAEYVEKKNLKKEYDKNKSAIDANNELSLKISSVAAKLTSFRQAKEQNISNISTLNGVINQNKKNISDREDMIKKLIEEESLVRDWKIYMDMVGKNGISKMVLRRALPIINANLSRLLGDVCDFEIEIAITEKNDVVFYLVRDGIKADLSSGSGFEKTASALALRAVLASISTLPRLNFLVFDEILGRVAKENYDNMRNLYEKILAEYDFILQISHLDEIKDWHGTTLTVCKSDNVSKLKVNKNV